MKQAMKTLRFPGGVHPPDTEKPRTRGLPIETFPAPGRVVLALQQNIGAPSKPIVKKGDEVLRGQPVAEAGGFVSVPMHSPVSGKVLEVGTCLHPTGSRCAAVVVENDGEDKAVEGLGEPVEKADSLEPQRIKDLIRDAGICGMGGAGFPTHVKLSPPENKPIDALILNGAECEPALSADHRLMLEEAEGIMRGVAYLRRALEREGKLPRVIVGLEDNKADAASALERAKSAAGLDCEIVQLPVRYPQGGEKQLIYALLGREVPPQSERGLPMDVGVVVQNVGTAFAVHEAIDRQVPLIERVLTVASDAVADPGNIRARLGTPLPEILAARKVAGDAKKLILGGPMMGMAQYTDDFGVMKTMSGVLLERKGPGLVEAGVFEPCIRCGRCVETCPMGLVPSRLSTLCEAGRFADMREWAVIDCMECGCCAYVCPARRPIIQHIKLGKWMFQQELAKERAKAAAEKEKEKEKGKAETEKAGKKEGDS